MAHTDFSTLEHVGQWEDEDGVTLVADLTAPGMVLSDLLGITDQIVLDTLTHARALIDSGAETWETINGDDDVEHYLWLVDLADVEVSA